MHNDKELHEIAVKLRNLTRDNPTAVEDDVSLCAFASQHWEVKEKLTRIEAEQVRSYMQKLS